MIKNISILASLLLYMVLFSACAKSVNYMNQAKSEALQNIQLDQRTGLLYIHRVPTTLVGAGAPIKIQIDDRTVGILGNDNGYIAVALNAGKHSISLTNHLFDSVFKARFINVLPNLRGLIAFSPGEMDLNIQGFHPMKLGNAILVDYSDLRHR